MGKAWRFVHDRFDRHIVLVVSILFCIGFVLANIYLHGEYKMRPNVWVGPIWQALLIIFLSLCGFSGVLLSLPTPRIPFINYVGEHSMVYFVMHYPIVLSYVYVSILLGHNMHGSIPDLIIMLLLSFTLCTLAVPFVERVPWLSGRKTPSNSPSKGRTVYFYHTKDTERIVREWKQGIFPSHFLYGALQLADDGFDIVWHHQKHTYKRLRDMIVATWKVLTCRKHYDVLYATHTLGIEPIILLRALGVYRHPIVVWHHQPIVKAKNPLREALARIFYRGMDHMIFFSEKLIEDSLLSKKADKQRMSMVHWGADLEYYSPLLSSPRGDGTNTPPLVGDRGGLPFISTGKELRDYETLLQAFHETGLPLTLYVEKKRQAYFESLHPKENIEIHYGDRPIPHEIAQLVAQSKCVCICCQKSNYTVGLTTVVEALALGKPILCTRNPQMPMDIEAEGCGFWIEVGDVEGWKEKLRYIASHPEEAKAMGKRGRALAKKCYNAKQCGKEVAQIIKGEKLKK
jgi:glycosyltransferase involved in cell wall biosynthesis